MFKKTSGEPPVPKFHDKDSLEKSLQETGISVSASRQLAELGRHSLHLLPIKSDKGDDRVFSKIGGIPDLPKGIEWPIRPSFPASAEEAPRGLLRRLLNKILSVRPSERELGYRDNPQPYNFIAQIAFKELTTAGAKDMEQPASGALYLFYDDLTQCWGFDPKDSIGFKVIYVSEIEDAASAQRPDFYDEVSTYNEVFVEPTLRFEHCHAEGLHFEKLPISEEDKEAYIQFDELVEEQSHLGWPSSPAHKVRGWSNNVQNPMEEECALVASGIYCGGPEASNSPEAKRIMAEPNDWVLLLQIDSDDGAGMMWGDAGMLYLWIKRSDLEQRNFDDTWLILQCG